MSRGCERLARWLALQPGLTILRGRPRGCLVRAVVWEVSCWSARSRVAVRTNELDAGERRPVMGGGEGPFVLAVWGAGQCPRRVVGGVVSQAPIRRARRAWRAP